MSRTFLFRVSRFVRGYLKFSKKKKNYPHRHNEIVVEENGDWGNGESVQSTNQSAYFDVLATFSSEQDGQIVRPKWGRELHQSEPPAGVRRVGRDQSASSTRVLRDRRLGAPLIGRGSQRPIGGVGRRPTGGTRPIRFEDARLTRRTGSQSDPFHHRKPADTEPRC